MVISSIFTLRTPQEGESCTICWEGFMDRNEAIIVHNEHCPTHIRCLEAWLKIRPRCPLCAAQDFSVARYLRREDAWRHQKIQILFSGLVIGIFLSILIRSTHHYLTTGKISKRDCIELLLPLIYKLTRGILHGAMEDRYFL